MPGNERPNEPGKIVQSKVGDVLNAAKNKNLLFYDIFTIETHYNVHGRQTLIIFQSGNDANDNSERITVVMPNFQKTLPRREEMIVIGKFHYESNCEFTFLS